MQLVRPHLTSFLLLCTSLAAQTHISSPSGLLNVEGQTNGRRFGSYSDARYMLFDGELRNAAVTIKEIAVRDDYFAHTERSAMGRSWSSVTLDISTSNMDNLTTIFANNKTSTPTRVFSGSVTWPTLSGHPGSLPAAWSKAFPFTTGWSYNGKDDICIDFDFQGGTMANNATWTTRDRYDYYLDAYPMFDRAPNTVYYHGKGGSEGGCIDSGGTQGGMNFLHVVGYGAGYHVPEFRNKYQLITMSYFTAPNQPVANVVNFVGSAAGIQFPGVPCNNLHLDVTKYLMITVSSASGPGAWSGYVYPSGTPEGLVPSSPAYVGLPMWAQAFWFDSKTSAMRLTRAVSTTIPWIPRDVRRATVCQPLTFMKYSTGNGPFETADYNPVLRYTN